MPDTSSPDEHPTLGLDDVVHQRTRLGILSLLRDGASMQFGVLRETLRLTDGNLNRHLKVLVDAGLLESTREEGKGRTRTWVTITPAGRAALDAEIAALRALIGAHD
ncbi:MULTISPECIES: transcriptional regulator [unclassified Rhodococcus (in: high G+C Gram-positive bacteria)]|uniref:transcriptional regulator n=1 Tax=unclassified Rhodococcus (in: high G+C Gram-positive bacteria) TaxID=192944 RepID=UPI00146AF39B|nr:transcriptional regulator [Rhodococcus sp. BL-253-APC-6A1W]NMD94645.1 helix-turn-helix domain-containing protein [Rhodococcus sp. BL-253-APC-6A1W]